MARFQRRGRRRRRKFRRRRRRPNKQTTQNIMRSENRFRYVELYPLQTANDASGSITCAMNVNSFTNFYVPAAGVQALPVNEARLYQVAQFDMYKVTYVKIEYIPHFGISSGPHPNNVSESGCIAVCYDPDNKGFPSSIQSLLTRDKARLFGTDKPWKFTIRLPNVNLPNQVVLQDGFLNTQSQANNQLGVIWLASTPLKDNTGTSLPANTIVGCLKTTVYVTWKGRQYNKSGEEGGQVEWEYNMLDDGTGGVTGPTHGHTGPLAGFP